MIKYSIKTLAEALGVHRNTVRNMILRGELTSLALKDVLEYAREQGRNEIRCAETQTNKQEQEKGADLS